MIVEADDREARDTEPLEQGPAVAKLGDLWQAGPHRILCGSALEDSSFQHLMDRKADIVVDPVPDLPPTRTRDPAFHRPVS